MTGLLTRRLKNASLGIVLIALAQSSGPGVAQDTDSKLARLAALEDRLGALETEIGLLEDAKAVKRLQRAYAYYIDKGLSSEIAQLFTADATAEIAGYGVFVGRDRIAELYEHLIGNGPVEGRLDSHLMLQPVVDVAPDGMTAKGRWRALVQLGEYGKTAMWSEGPYENEYVKEDGVWRIKKLHWYMTLLAPYDPGWHLAPLPMPGPLEDLPPDRPPSEQYGAYPDVYLPKYHYDNPVSGRPAGGQP